MSEDSAEAESDSSSDSELDDYILDKYILGRDVGRDVGGDVALNRDGSIRKVRRNDYSRSAREVPRPRENVWTTNKWLLLLRNPQTSDPKTKKGE